MSNDVLSLRGRVAVVTGGARGVGAATARLFARAGARVAVLDVNGSGAEETASAVEEDGGEALPLASDVTKATSVRAAVKAVVGRWGRLDILVNNAGVIRDATLLDLDEAGWTETIDVNLRGPMLCARAAVPHMMAAGWGRIISATSVSARMGNYGQTAYTAAKAGVIGMTRTWARELARHGITANAVAPGLIATETMRGIPERVLQTLVDRTAPRRLGTPEEVASVYLFLASDLASFVNGAVIGVDGGLLL
jgi:3-oxoacyl-[acyl-carrier protein] reductase